MSSCGAGVSDVSFAHGRKTQILSLSARAGNDWLGAWGKAQRAPVKPDSGAASLAPATHQANRRKCRYSLESKTHFHLPLLQRRNCPGGHQRTAVGDALFPGRNLVGLVIPLDVPRVGLGKVAEPLVQ